MTIVYLVYIYHINDIGYSYRCMVNSTAVQQVVVQQVVVQ